MSYDEEALVRQRLRRVLPLATGSGSTLVGVAGVGPGGSDPTGSVPGGNGHDLGDQIDPVPGDSGYDPAGVVPGEVGLGGRPPGLGSSETGLDGIPVGVRPPRSPLGPSDAGPSSPGPLSPLVRRPGPAGRDRHGGRPGPQVAGDAWRHAESAGGEDPAGGRSVLPGPGAFDPGRRGVRALAVVAVLVVLGAGFWAWRSRPQAEPVPPLADATAVGTVPAGSEPSATPGDELVVAVAGKVRRPGLVRVPAGARVADAVRAAGGALPGVDVALLNPARKVADGELIVVGVTGPPGATPPAGAADPAGAAAGGKVNLNTATLAQLDALPGVGPVLAQRILTHRDQHGGFRSVGDLRQVDGIGSARYEQLKDLVTV